MTRRPFIVGAAAVAFAMSLTPAWAQRTNSGDTVGSATTRGGDSSGSSSGSSSSGSSSSGSSSSSSGSSAGSSSSSGWNPGAYSAPRAPERPSDQHERAVVRGGGGGGGTASDGSRSRGGSATGSTVGLDGSGYPDPSPVPPYGRPREGRPSQGTATERRGPLPGDGGGNYYWGGGGGGGYYYYPSYDPYYYGYYDPYYYGYRYGYSPYWVPGYGFGLGFFAYDPFLFGGYAYGAPYPYATLDPAAGYGGAYGGGSSSSYRTPVGTGSLRLKIKPGLAQVFVDGYYVGLVESFDGVFQRLDVEAGTHKVEIKAEGFEPAQIDVVVKPGETVAYKGDLKKIR